MTKTTPQVDTRDDKHRLFQLRLPFQDLSYTELRAGSLRRTEAVREELLHALDTAKKEHGLCRSDIAEEMSRLTGETINVNHLNDWCAESKRAYKVPLEYLAALYVVTGHRPLIEASLEGLGFHLVDRDEYRYCELGRIAVEDRVKAKRKRKLMEDLGV